MIDTFFSSAFVSGHLESNPYQDERDRVRASLRAPSGARGEYPRVDEREVLPSHDCEVCNIEQPLKSGSATVPRAWPLGQLLSAFEEKKT